MELYRCRQRTPAQEHSGAARHFEQGRKSAATRFHVSPPTPTENATPARLTTSRPTKSERGDALEDNPRLQNEIVRSGRRWPPCTGRRSYANPLCPTREQPIPTSAPSSDTSRKTATWPSLPRPRGFQRETIIAALSRNEGNRSVRQKNSTSPRARSTAKSRSLITDYRPNETISRKYRNACLPP